MNPFDVLVLICKAIIAIQQLCEGVLGLIVSQQRADKQKALTDAIALVKGATTKDEKSNAAKSLADAFGSPPNPPNAQP